MKADDIHEVLGEYLVCTAEHDAGFFTPGKLYKVLNRPRIKGDYRGVRIRDNKGERADFNMLPWSNSYLWKYFRRREDGE